MAKPRLNSDLPNLRVAFMLVWNDFPVGGGECCRHLQKYLRDPHSLPEQPIFVYLVWTVGLPYCVINFLSSYQMFSVFLRVKGKKKLLSLFL